MRGLLNDARCPPRCEIPPGQYATKRKTQAFKELPPAASTGATGGAGDEASSATPRARAKTSKTGKAAAAAAVAAAAAPGVTSWADRLRDFQIDVPASAAYDELASNPDSNPDARAQGRGGSVAEVGAEQEQQGEQDQEVSSWDGVGVDATTVIHHRRQFDARCKAYEVW